VQLGLRRGRIPVTKRLAVEHTFVFSLRLDVMYTAVESMHFSPLLGRWLALARGPLLFVTLTLAGYKRLW
jgi:hypothetical protein